MRVQAKEQIVDIQSLSEGLTDLSMDLQLSGGLTELNIAKHSNDISSLGINVNKLAERAKSISLSEGSTATQQTGGANQYRYEISDMLIQDFAPVNDFTNSPFAVMMPSRSINATYLQQDIMASNFGFTPTSDGYNSAINQVEMLDVKSKKYTGFMRQEAAYMVGQDLINLRVSGSSNTAANGGSMQRLNFTKLNMLNRQYNSMEMTRISALLKGEYPTVKDDFGSTGIPVENVTQFSQVMGTYYKATNKFDVNPANTANPFLEMGNMLSRIKGMGVKIKEIVMDYRTYNIMWQLSALRAQTAYISAVSNNDVQTARTQAFQYNMIPEFQGISIRVDGNSIKIENATTSVLNTRPTMWGFDVTPDSFRASIVIEQTGMSRVGDFGIFPNLYLNSPMSSDTLSNVNAGGIGLIEQFLGRVDITQQKIQVISTATYGVMSYLPSGIFVFDFNVNVQP